jgi:hypothetical protein
MFVNMSKTGPRKGDAENAPAAALILTAIFILILFSVVSCSGGGENDEGAAETPGTETGPAPKKG